ncbi:hypothetical protein [Marivivens aquimaris]|uniref:hypothetical protein n=1 Tax=Marivivens aquimaris TaxID=2774876 RepID=UPI001882C443|nr:hypothetical protein [Marivivens aquimaris]
MLGVNYVVRNGSGIRSGVVSGDGMTSVISVAAGEDVSLNLASAQISKYTRDGQTLNIELIDGRVIAIEGYFTPAGVERADLYISSGSILQDVVFAEGSDGYIWATYVESDPFGKTNPDSDLFFVGSPQVIAPYDADVVDMLDAPLLGGLGGAAGPALGLGLALLGAGLLNGGGGGTKGGGDETAEVDLDASIKSEPYIVINEESYPDGFEVFGTGTVGGTVTVTIDGVEKTTTVDANGDWSVTYDGGDIPEGTYTEVIAATIEVTAESGDVLTDADSGKVVVDTELTVTLDAVTGDDFVNEAEVGAGITLTGKVEANSTVTVTIDGTEYDATVTGTTWSLDLPDGVVTYGNYTESVTVTAVDSFDNVEVITGSFVVDSSTFITIDAIEAGADDVMNAAEASGGAAVTGTAEAGATVTVVLNPTSSNAVTLSSTADGQTNVTKTTTADADGNWSVSYTASELPDGEGNVKVNATAEDAAGNTASTSTDLDYDTVIELTHDNGPVGGDGIVNADEQSGAIVVTGLVDVGSTVNVTLGGETLTTTSTDGTWSVTFPAGTLPTGQGITADLTVDATDPAGNTAQLKETIEIDTIVDPLGIDPVEGDNIINAEERADGIVITGEVEEGSTVQVTFDGITKDAVVDGTTWTVEYDADEVRTGEYDTEVTVVATDKNGNVGTVSEDITVDTIAPDTPIVNSADQDRNYLRSVGVLNQPDTLQIYELDDTGAVTKLEIEDEYDARYDEIDLIPTTPIADGAQLVLQAEDAAGNVGAGLFVKSVNGNNTIDLDNPGLEQFDLTSIDLQFADNATLTMTGADVVRLTGEDNTLTIFGDTDDTLSITGAVATGQTAVVDQKSFTEYELGDSSTLLIQDDINVVI